MNVHAMPSLPLDPELAEALTIEAHRRMDPHDTRDVREVVAAMVRGTLAELVERLQADDVHPRSRFCRCSRCAPLDLEVTRIHIEGPGCMCGGLGCARARR